MPKCDFYELRGWANDYCMIKEDYVDSYTYENYCRYASDGCPIKKNANSSSDGCYLTTACVEYKGLEDNCMELMTLRAFRDGYIASRDNGQADIEEYYKTAPAIVEAINNTEEAAKVYEGLYLDVILPCVDLINNEKNEEAYEKYKTMVKDLEEKYC